MSSTNDYGNYNVNSVDSNAGGDNTGLKIGIIAIILVVVVPVLLVGGVIFFVMSNVFKLIDEHSGEIGGYINGVVEDEKSAMSATERKSVSKFIAVAGGSDESALTQYDCANLWSAAQKAKNGSDKMFVAPCFNAEVGVNADVVSAGIVDDDDESVTISYKRLYLVDNKYTKCYTLTFDDGVNRIDSVEVANYADSVEACKTAKMVKITQMSDMVDDLDDLDLDNAL